MSKLAATVQMLGGFQITLNGVTITDQDNHAKKPWSILEYLITFHNKQISSSELIELHWADSDSANPNGALKTLIFRTRSLLEPFKIPTRELIIQKQGAYSWNPAIELSIDTDRFETLCKQSSAPGLSDEDRLPLLLDALELYHGDFLPKLSWEAWVIPISTYYHSLFLQTAHQAIELLFARSEWGNLIQLCSRAIEIEPFDEDFHYYLIYALHNTGEQNKALSHYQHTTDLFYNEFAITPSERLKDLYKLIRDEKHGITTDLSLIQASMLEDLQTSGAYFCEYSVFRDIYQLERRAIGRTGDSIFLCLLTVSNEDGELPRPSVTAKAMEHLGKAVAFSLRRGDIYTRYSISQYLILLPTASYENGGVVMQRILRNFKKAYVRKELIVHYSLQAIVAADEAE